jgi:hypothetical protein
MIQTVSSADAFRDTQTAYRIIHPTIPSTIYRGTNAFPDCILEQEPVPSTNAGSTEELDICADLQYLHQRSGLTWREVAVLFNVTERTIHFWLRKQRPMQQEKLDFLSGLKQLVSLVDRGRPYKTRTFLREHFLNNKGLVDLLRAQNFPALHIWASKLPKPVEIFHPPISTFQLQERLPADLSTLLASTNIESKSPISGKGRPAKVGRIPKK